MYEWELPHEALARVEYIEIANMAGGNYEIS